MRGCRAVIGLDIDEDALEIARGNAEEMELDLDLVRCDIGVCCVMLA